MKKNIILFFTLMVLSISTPCFAESTSYTFTFAPIQENVTQENLNQIKKVFQNRLNASGYNNHTMEIKDGTIILNLATDSDEESIKSLLTKKTELKFINSAGEIILSGKDIKAAKYQYGQTVEYGYSEEYIEVTLNPESVEKWAAATRNAIGTQISIMVDDSTISSPTVNAEINSETCIISGDFTEDSAKELAAQINSGTLPFEMDCLSVTKVRTTESFPYNILNIIRNFFLQLMY